MTDTPIRNQQHNEKFKSETNEIFIGNKPFMKYVVASLMQLQKQENKEAVIKARGKFISRAVDIAEVTKKKLKETDNLELKEEIKIGTDSFKNTEGKDINVSTIDILLRKQ
ncbi:DNA-binding protein Alba [Candidatus Pacearchaeota archaeon]|nr:DNA-binding protein Alba [Candidatus Pacearchaeota archaeon]|tara:strand:- start:8904 stop:9236 length:333 start_codon:yes stop_codon:yes gene_type:complete